MNYDEVLSRFVIKKQNNGNPLCICPSHDDKQASLSITQDKTTGNTLLYCHAGCEIQEILNSVGLKMADLFQDSNNKRVTTMSTKAAESTIKPTVRPKIKEIYNYTDEKGNTIYQVLRYEPKDFRCRQPKAIDFNTITGESIYNDPLDNNNFAHWLNNIKGVSRTLYKLYDLANTIHALQEKVYFVEGEKDVHTLNKLGLYATTVGGVKNWRTELANHFNDADVIILPDNDRPGKQHAFEVAYDIQQAGANSIKILELPGLPPKGDVTDWIEQGHALEELKALVDNCKEYMAADDYVESENIDTQTQQEQKNKPERKRSTGKVQKHLLGKHLSDLLTDLNNANRLKEQHGDNFRFDVNAQKFINWNGKQWEYDDLGTVKNIAAESIKTYYNDFDWSKYEDEDQKRILRHIQKSQNKYGLDSMVGLVKERPGIPIRSNMLNNDTMLLNCNNGTLDLRTGKLQPHNKEQLITKIVDMDYDQSATCPTWDKFINDIFCGDTELIHYVQKVLGYALTGDTKEQCFFLLYGKGANGKSTLINVLKDILKDYCKSTQTETFIDMNNNSAPKYNLADLPGARIVTAIETKEGGKLDEQLVKQVTGGDTITARQIRCECFDFVPQFKLFLAVNHLPTISGQDNGIWRRVNPIPFNAKFEGDKDNKNLAFELQMEYPGILVWLVNGCLLWQNEKIGTCAAVEVAKNKYKGDMDIMGDFLSDCCIIEQSASVKSSLLYNVYVNWAVRNGIKRPMTQTRFSLRLEERGNFERVRTGGGIKWYGIGVIDNHYPDDDEPQNRNNTNTTNQNNIQNTNINDDPILDNDDLSSNAIDTMYGVYSLDTFGEHSTKSNSIEDFPKTPQTLHSIHNPGDDTPNFDDIPDDDFVDIDDMDNVDNSSNVDVPGVPVNVPGTSTDYDSATIARGECIKCHNLMTANFMETQKLWVGQCNCGQGVSIPNWRVDTWRKDLKE